MNVWNGLGRIVRDPELKYSRNNLAICNFTLAVERGYQKQGEEKKSDFINCVVFGATAEKFVSVYFKKGMRIGVTGELQIERFEKEGKTEYYTKIIVNRAYFADGKRDNQGDAHESLQGKTEGFYPVSDDDELPF